MKKLKLVLKRFKIISTSKRVKNLFFGLVDAPVLKDIYMALYRRQIKKAISSSCLVLNVEPYNMCNLKCVMCPYPKMTREKELMTMELYTRIIKEAAELGCDRIAYSVYNEPLLDPHLFERIKLAKEHGMRTNMASNATLLNKENAVKILDSGLDYVNFSVDSFDKETYDKIRVGGKHEKTVENIVNFYKEREKLGLKKPFISISIVQMKMNAEGLDKTMEFFKKYSDVISLAGLDNRKDLYGTDDSFVEDNDLFFHTTVYSH